MRLSAAQKRHLVELYGDGDKTFYWMMRYGSPQHRSALVLRRLGLVEEEGSIVSGDGGFRLTTAGRDVASALAGSAGLSAAECSDPRSGLSEGPEGSTRSGRDGTIALPSGPTSSHAASVAPRVDAHSITSALTEAGGAEDKGSQPYSKRAPASVSAAGFPQHTPAGAA